jgi:nicotinamide riboside kinase
MRVWRGALERRDLPFVLIRGNWEERERAAIEAINRVLSS